MKFASSAWRVKQMSHRAADNRAEDTEHNCPRDREVRVHERFGDTTHKEADKDIPDEMKHYFLLLTPDSAKITSSNIRTAGAQPFKNFASAAIFQDLECQREAVKMKKPEWRITKKTRMTKLERP
jgi:hypothetical protein